MSSHHIVKDKQEPALIIANGAECSSELLNELLEWSPFVLVLDGAINRVLPLEIKIDALLGDFDSISEEIENIKKIQFPIEIISAPYQNKTDLEKGIDYLISEGHLAANIVWATGRRADHNFANICLLAKYAQHIKLQILDDYSIIYPLLPEPQKFIKWFAAKTPISLIPIGTATCINTINLKYSLDGSDLVVGQRMGNSNEVLNDGLVEISYKSGALLIMECND